NNSLTADDLGTNSVNSDEIATGAVGSDEIANGSISAADLADDYVNVSGDFMNGALTMNAQNQVRFADSAGGEYVAFRAPATVSSNVLWTLPDDDATTPTPSNWVLSSNGSGTLSWAPPSAPADNMGNHTAGLNVQLNGFWLSGDGGNEGLQIDASGNISFSGNLSGSGANLTSVGSSAIADGSIAVGDLNTASVDGRYLRGDTNDTMSGSLTATSFISTSDRRLKTNIETIPGLDVILNMRGVRFDWIESGEPEIGLIAQEVEAVMPELVVTNEEGMKAVKYSNLVSPLIESTKELYGMCQASEKDLEIHDRRIASLEENQEEMQNKIKYLEKENEQLKGQLNDMDQRLKALEAMIKGR
ncbi:MAG: tail fiber domain-containing protein, partial [Bdellovibrionales bacterium]|nr:tail fiber domain-containing protein [Bdellovibrionales bacterium]